MVKKLLSVILITFSFTTFAQKIEGQEGIENAFDFWVGKWEVQWQGKDSIQYGKNEIKKILNGNVLQEFFEDGSGSYRGTSISVYNPKTRQWHQAWADSNGDFFNFVGIVTDTTKTFITEKPDSSGRIFKMQFLNIKKSDFDWVWSASKDGGINWTNLWEIAYKRLE